LSFSQKELSDRKKMILKVIIDAHIDLGEPVGSKYLTQNKQIAYSSATIRNEMAELEDMGFLEQPYTSAGRVPSEMGYRFYVDSLIERYNITSREISDIRATLRTKMSELDKIFESATRIASYYTNYTALSVKPKVNYVTISRYETVYLDSQNFILVMITGIGVVKTKYIRLGCDVGREMVAQLAEVLNDCLTNIAADNITLPIIMQMEARMGVTGEFLINPIIKTIYEAINDPMSGELKFEGLNRLLQYPEYYDIDRLKEMLQLLESKDDILNAISDYADENIKIYIGSENSVKIMNNSTLIFKPVKSGGRVVGAIGIIGPCRMDYSKVIALINHITGNIKEVIEEGNSLPQISDDS
jgi:heat shock gene repressor HrcA